MLVWASCLPSLSQNRNKRSLSACWISFLKCLHGDTWHTFISAFLSTLLSFNARVHGLGLCHVTSSWFLNQIWGPSKKCTMMELIIDATEPKHAFHYVSKWNSLDSLRCEFIPYRNVWTVVGTWITATPTKLKEKRHIPHSSLSRERPPCKRAWSLHGNCFHFHTFKLKICNCAWNCDTSLSEAEIL